MNPKLSKYLARKIAELKNSNPSNYNTSRFALPVAIYPIELATDEISITPKGISYKHNQSSLERLLLDMSRMDTRRISTKVHPLGGNYVLANLKPDEILSLTTKEYVRVIDAYFDHKTFLI